MLKIGFVDLENIGSFAHIDVREYDTLHVFRGVNQHQIEPPAGTRVVLHDIEEIGRNNLDFHLSLYLGTLHVSNGLDVEFVVLSRDKGFDGICEHLAGKGRLCSRVNPFPQPAACGSKRVIDIVIRLDVNRRPKTLAKLRNYLGAQLGAADYPHVVDMAIEQLRATKTISFNCTGEVNYAVGIQ